MNFDLVNKEIFSPFTIIFLPSFLKLRIAEDLLCLNLLSINSNINYIVVDSKELQNDSRFVVMFVNCL